MPRTGTIIKKRPKPLAFSRQDEHLLTDILSYAGDPAGFVAYAFPWEQEGTALANETGPDRWHLEVLDYIASQLGREEPIRIAIASGHGVGKAQPTSLVLDTPTGQRRFGELRVGDWVFGSDGAPIRVRGVFPQGRKAVYRVGFDDGASTLACGEHLWAVQGRNLRRGMRPDYEVLSTKTLLQRGITRKNGHSDVRQWALPPTGPVQYPFRWIPVDPYTLGYWLGDGTANTALVTTQDEEPLLRMRQAGYVVTQAEWSKRTLDKTPVFNVGRLEHGLRQLGLAACRSYERFVPTSYKENILDIRLAVLQGLLDSDGYVDKDGKPSFTSSSEQLAMDVVWLLRSLGGKARLSKGKPTGYRKADGAWQAGRLAYIVTFALPPDSTVFTLPRKQERYRAASQKRYVTRWLDSIEPVGEEECQCIQVDAPNQLYLCNDFIPTHNTTLIAWLILWFMSTRPHPQIPVTASTTTQLSTKTWRELAYWHQLAVHKDWFRWTATRFYRVGFEETWYASAIPWSEEKAQSWAGTHAEHVLVAYDEGSTIGDGIYEVTDGIMSTPGAIWIVVGNPEQATGRFRDCFGRYRQLWRTWEIDARTSKKTNKAEIERQIEAYGIDSDFVRVRWLGKFPRQGPSQFISEALVEEAQRRIPMGYEHMPKVMGADIGGQGTAATVLTLRQGVKIEWIKDYHGLRTDQIADEIAKSLLEDTEIALCCVDVVGIGAGVYGDLMRMGFQDRVSGVISGASGTELLPGTSLAKYFNLRAQMWGHMKDWLEKGGCLPVHPQLASDLPAPKYAYVGERQIQLERKADMLSRGVASPDYGDSLAFTFARPVAPRPRPQTAPQSFSMPSPHAWLLH